MRTPPHLDSVPLPLVQAWLATMPWQHLQPAPNQELPRPRPAGQALVQLSGSKGVLGSSSRPTLLLLLSVLPAMLQHLRPLPSRIPPTPRPSRHLLKRPQTPRAQPSSSSRPRLLLLPRLLPRMLSLLLLLPRLLSVKLRAHTT